jgi:catechol 2,3-dioxygenase-like lactoylglutathione lyase family enzyme
MDNIPVLGIHETAFEVPDLERSIAFYRDILGLPLYSRGPQQDWSCIRTQRLGAVYHDRPGGGQHFAFLIPRNLSHRKRQSRRAML